MDEFEWEKFLRESDKRTEKYGELLAKYHDHPDCDEIIDREMGWDDSDKTDEERQRDVEFIEEMNAACEDAEPLEPNPLTEGKNWIRDNRGNIHHPQTVRMREAAMKMWHYCDDRKLFEDEETHEMVFHFLAASTKTAGALDDLAYDLEKEDGFIVAYLKRAMPMLNQSIALAQTVREKRVVAPEMMDEFVKELFWAREEILRLMNQYRRS